MDDTLVAAVDDLLAAARAAARTPEFAQRVDGISARLHGPLLVAIAGRVKAGKSTLLNGMLGEGLAAVDATECTRIVTWYRRGTQPQVSMVPISGAHRPLPFHRQGGELEIDLDGNAVEDIDRLEIAWPTPRLAELTLVDTPGIASISVEVSARTQRILTPDDDTPPAVDAIVYLLRHTHASDAHFLEAFHDDQLARGSPINVIGVLSRADEIGSCRMDAMEVADRVARRYQGDPRLRRLCPVVVPVAGLLAYAGTTLREDEFRALALMAAMPADERRTVLLTADRFASRPCSAAVTEIERVHLLNRLGLFGVRLSVDLIVTKAAPDATTLAAMLSARSGLDRLREVLGRQFTHRSQILKARSALAGLREVVNQDGCTGTATLQSRIEQLTVGTHAFEELRLLSAIRTDETDDLDEARRTELDRLLGGSGHDSASRLGLSEDAPDLAIRDEALRTLERWQRISYHPMSSRSLQVAATGACRTLEGIIAETGEASSQAASPVR
jgi:hypothetical protein